MALPLILQQLGSHPLTMLWATLVLLPLALALPQQAPFRADVNDRSSGPRVNVTLNVMSRCPDAVCHLYLHHRAAIMCPWPLLYAFDH